MTLSRDEHLAVERAIVRGWPALETAEIDGWLARFASGGSVRANTTSALDFAGADLDAALARVIAFYRVRGAAPRFVITGVETPANLDAELDQRGWQRHGEHVTMTKAITPATAPSPVIEIMSAPTDAWSDVYLQGLSEDRRAIAMTMVTRVPAPRAFFAARLEGRIIASGLSVADGAFASVQCMATLPAARRSGAATAVLAAIEAYARDQGARRLYLQTERDNAAAIALYERIGFRIAARYHTRVLMAEDS